mmetsp:Transcript_29337/g.52520  ORF Transcript_29337/g.52520 Transcript_29337/m.52520 type:complete len:301 (+) Transcript_29337:136-1038(+)
MGVPFLVIYSVGGLFVVLSLIVSLLHFAQHLLNFCQPEYQRYICRILLMVPLYAVTSWLSMYRPQNRIWMDLLCSCYEAFVIYSFTMLLINYSGGERRLVMRLELKERVAHPWPLNMLFRDFYAGPKFLRIVKGGVLQFVVIRPMIAVIVVVCSIIGKYHENYFGVEDSYVYVFALNNLSFTLALYMLVLFFMATHEFLEPFKPYPKFLCVKLVVFFCFWQGVVLFLLVKLDVIHGANQLSAENVAVTLQEFLICVEMLCASIAHRFAFAYEEFLQPIDPERMPISDRKVISSIKSVRSK